MLSASKFYPSFKTMILGLGYTLESPRNHFKRDDSCISSQNLQLRSSHSQVILKQSY